MARTLQLLSYTYVDDMLERRGPHRDGHLALIDQWHRDGRMVLAGAVGDPPHAGLLLFDVPGAAAVSQFVDADPYVAAGLVVSHSIEPVAAVVG